jgi:hypothetical protein
MAYTVVSVFPVTVDTEKIKKDLKENGFDEANIIVSKSNVEAGLDHYQEDEQTKGFSIMFLLMMQKCLRHTVNIASEKIM